MCSPLIHLKFKIVLVRSKIDVCAILLSQIHFIVRSDQVTDLSLTIFHVIARIILLHSISSPRELDFVISLRF